MNGDHDTAFYTERRTYRRRRMADAATFVPFLGGALFLLPVIWTGPAVLTSSVMIYLFPVWAGLSVLSVVLSRDLARGDADEGDASDAMPQGSADKDPQE